MYDDKLKLIKPKDNRRQSFLKKTSLEASPINSIDIKNNNNENNEKTP